MFLQGSTVYIVLLFLLLLFAYSLTNLRAYYLL